MDSKAYGQACAEQVFNELNKENWAKLEDLQRCIGNIDDDTPHTIMEEQLTAQAGDGQEGEVFILPTLRINGKTQCLATFSGFSCTCGQGFISHKEADGSETCLDINECLSITQLDPKCTCERCGCKNTYGGYE